MITSLIKPDLQYIPNKAIEPQDIGLINVQVYEIKLLDIPIFICLGSIDNKHQATHNIIISPIYLIDASPSKMRVVQKIGLFEFPDDSISQYTTQPDQYIDLEKITTFPIIFDDNNLKKVLQKYSSSNTNPTKSVDIDDIDKPTKTDKDDDLDAPNDIDKLTKTDKDDDLDAANDIDKNSPTDIDLLNPLTPWIVKHMKDINFTIQPNDGDGECFFYVFAQAFLSIDPEKDNQYFRNIIADNFSVDMYNNYLELYKSYDIQPLTDDLEQLRKNIYDKKRLLTTLSKDESKNDLQTTIDLLLDDQQKIISNIKELKKDLKDALDDVTLPIKLMNTVNSLDELREIIRTPKSLYWADESAILIIENKLNIKTIILEQEQEDIVCKYLTDKNFPSPKNPDYFIILNKTRVHYELIKYKNMGIFNFEQLPKHIIRKITDKCLEDPDSAFAQIPDFKILRNDFLKKHPKIPTNEIVPDGSSDTERGSPEDIDARLAQLYDDKCTFTYYKGSANKPAGSGNLEQCDSRKSEFSALNSFTDWRKKLSNSYTPLSLKFL